MKRWAALGLVVLLAGLGFVGYRWWDGDDHRAQQFVSQLRETPGVQSAWHSKDDEREYVTLRASASRGEVASVIRTLSDRAIGEERNFATVMVGQAFTVIRRYVNGERVAPLLLALGGAQLPVRVEVSEGSGTDIRAELPEKSGATTIDVARTVLQAFVKSPSALRGGIQVWIKDYGSAIGKFGEVTMDVDQQNVQPRLALMDRARSLAKWRPALGLYPKEMNTSLVIPKAADVPVALKQARSVLGPQAHISYLLGGVTGTRVVGDENPARVLALVSDLTSNDQTEVTSVGPHLSSVDVSTSYDALPAALDTVAKAKVGSVHVRWPGSELEASSTAARNALPGITQLHDLGYTVVWVPSFSAGGPARIGVAPTGSSPEDRAAASSRLEGQTGGLSKLSQAVRALGWPGRVEVHIPVVMDGKLEDQIFLSTATGRAARAPRAAVPATGVTDAWDKTATHSS